MTSPSSSPPRHVRVYGNDHSPWVQSVLLGLHELRVAHTNVTAPPLSVFRESGVLMPAAKIDDGPWLLDSERILVELGFAAVAEEEREALWAAFAGALERTDSAWGFWYSWSYLRDGHPVLAQRLWNHVWRAFSVFYFFTVITFARRSQPRRRVDFSYWEERLEQPRPFLGGETPDTVDLQLFGLVEMYASIPGPTLAALREDPKLPRVREWIGRMHRRFSSYGHLYSGPHFEPRLPDVERSPVYERPFYWLGCVLVWLAAPISLATTLYYVRSIRRRGLQRG